MASTTPKSMFTLPQLIDVLFKIVVPGILIWVVAIETRVAVMESNRFTDRDGHNMEDRIRGWVESRYPPEWLKKDLDEIKERLRVIETKVNSK